jgi:hypothetical protein
LRQEKRKLRENGWKLRCTATNGKILNRLAYIPLDFLKNRWRYSHQPKRFEGLFQTVAVGLILRQASGRGRQGGMEVPCHVI